MGRRRHCAWNVHLSEPVSIPGYICRAYPGLVRGVQPRDQHLVLVLPFEKFDADEGAVVVVAKHIQWWNPGCPIICKSLNRGSTDTVVDAGQRAIPMLVHDTIRQTHGISYASPHVLPRVQAPEEPVAMTAGRELALHRSLALISPRLTLNK